MSVQYLQTANILGLTSDSFLNGVDSKIAGINKRLADLRNGLVTIEQKGPTKVELPASLSGPGRFFFTSTAPDVITPESVAAVVERATKIPVQRLLASDKNRLLNLQESLAKQVSSTSRKRIQSC